MSHAQSGAPDPFRCGSRLWTRCCRGAKCRRQRPGTDPAAPTAVSFNREILPILANNCFACHGPDEKQRETKFHFDTEEGMFLKKGVIEPGNAAESLLVEKITEPNPEGSNAAARLGARADREADRPAAPMDR